MTEEQRDIIPEEEEFKPRGTVLILIVFIITLILLWGYIYLLLLQRGVTV